jgi:PTS system mannose-specific IIA component
MVSLLVVTHGNLAEELVKAAKHIVGDVGPLSPLAIGWDDDVTTARSRIEEAIESLDGGEGVIVATDMFGGTPTNISLSLLKKGKVEIVTGVNLPMLIKFTNLREPLPLEELAARLSEQGRNSIQVASGLLLKGKHVNGREGSPD